VCTKKKLRIGISINDLCALDLAQNRGEIKCKGMMDKEHQWNTWRSARQSGG
jgi:hypothetical protein